MTSPTSHARWLELAVPAHPEAVEAVSEILDRVGSGGIAVEEPLDAAGTPLVKTYLPDDRAARPRVRRVREALGHLQAFGLGPIGELRLRRIDDEDWVETWKRSFVPVRIGSYHLRPSWASASRDGAIDLVIDPGMAFGTGLHPTTRQCLEVLSTPLSGARVLDVGTGSGILAVAAALRGAREVAAVDTDALAVRAAREAAAANAVDVDVRRGSAADVPGTFDVVLANIVAPTLVRIAGDLKARLAPGGALVVAGVIASAEDEVREAFAPLVVGQRDVREDWVCLVLSARGAPYVLRTAL